MSDETSLPLDRLDSHFDGIKSPVPKVVLARSAGPDDGMIDDFLESICHVNFAKTAGQVGDLLKSEKYDLVLIDSTLLDMDNISAIGFIKTERSCPYIIIRAETDDEIDRVLALEMGADDCVGFSCGYREIRARVRAFFRRQSNYISALARSLTPSELKSASRLIFCDWTLDKDRCKLFSPSGKSVTLTHAEYLIISALFSEPDAIKDRHSLTSLGNEAEQLYSDRGLDVFISRIRKKIAKIADEDLIQTVRGKGYKLIRRPTEVTENR